MRIATSLLTAAVFAWFGYKGARIWREAAPVTPAMFVRAWASSPEPMFRALARHSDPVFGYPGIMDSLLAMSELEQFTFMSDLVTRGLPALDDVSLTNHWRVTARAFSDMPPESCAQYARGTVDQRAAADFNAAAGRLDSAEIDALAAARMRAALAALRHDTQPIEAGVVDARYRRLFETMPVEDVSRIGNALDPSDGLIAPSERCWALRRLIAGALALPEDERTKMLAVLAAP